MWAVIFESAAGAGLHDIAGRPLLIRQLQWLRDNRVAPIAIEVCDGARAGELAALLFGSDPLLDGCVVLPSRAPLGLDSLALRAGAPRAEPLLGLANDLLLSGPLPAPCLDGRYRAAPPPGFANPPVELRVAAPGKAATAQRHHTGWGLRVDSPATAHALSCAVLAGRAPGVLVHAAEIKPGVWLGRGATSAPDALLRPPVLLGAEARVLSGAVVGPDAVLGRRALVERSARVVEASVADDTWVGEGASLHRVHADGARVESLSGAPTRLESDPLVLGTQRAAAGTGLGARLLALGLLCLLALPWSLLALRARARGRRALATRTLRGASVSIGQLGSWLDCAPALFDAVRGQRDLLGPSDPELLEALPESCALRLAALDITPALAPSPHRGTQLRMWRWYACHRSSWRDWRLALRSLRRRLAG